MFKFEDLAEYIISFIYPPRCVFCREVLESKFGHGCESWVCSECAKNIPFIDSSGNKVISVVEYKDNVRRAFYALKYGNRPHIAKTLARITFDNTSLPEMSNVCCFAPVPMYHKKQKERGYNQAGLYAKELSVLYGVSFVENLLRRTKDTPPQSGLNTQERRKNVEGAFEFNTEFSQFVFGKAVLLIDDIHTTGATLDECSKVLLDAGAKEIFCLAFASTIIKQASVSYNL